MAIKTEQTKDNRILIVIPRDTPPHEKHKAYNEIRRQNPKAKAVDFKYSDE